MTMTHRSHTEESLYSRGETSTQKVILEGKGIIIATKMRKKERNKEREIDSWEAQKKLLERNGNEVEI